MEIGGKQISNWWIVGGAGGLVLVYIVYKRSKSSSTSAQASTSTSIDPVTGLPYSQDNQIDPLTGMTFLSEAQQYGSVAAAESAVSSGAASADSTSTGYTGTAGYPSSNVGTTTGTAQNYATNAAWAQACTAGLTALGYSSTDVSAALGLFFAQHPLGIAPDGVNYALIIQTCEAEYGPPPQGTYQIMPPPSSGGGTTTTPVDKFPAPPELKVTGKSSTSVSLSWENTNPPAGSFTVAVYQENGKVASQTTVSVPDTTGGQGVTTITGLVPKYSYNIHVWANGGTAAPPHSTVSVTLP